MSGEKAAVCEFNQMFRHSVLEAGGGGGERGSVGRLVPVSSECKFNIVIFKRSLQTKMSASSEPLDYFWNDHLCVMNSNAKCKQGQL